MTQPQIDGKFATQEAAQLAEVRRQLQEVENELAAIAGKVPHAALRQALGNPEPGDEDVLRQQQAAEARLHLLRHAEQAALQAEQDRLQAKAHADDAAKRRAFSQHAARMRKAAQRFTAAATNANAALVDLLEAGRAAYATAPPAIQRSHSGPLSPSYLARIARAELGRLDSDNPIGARLFEHAMWTQDLRRGNGWITLHDLIDHHLTGLTGIVAKLLPDFIPPVREADARASIVEPPEPVQPPEPRRLRRPPPRQTPRPAAPQRRRRST